MTIVFDFDGVLADSLVPVTESIDAALGEHGFAQRGTEELRRFIGPPTYVAFSELLALPAHDPLVAEVVATYRRTYASVYLAQTSLYDGIAEMLEALAAGDEPLALATSKSVTFAQPLLDALGIAGSFAAVAAAAPNDAEDDKTAIVARALAQTRASGGTMVGDRRFDVEAALAHGLRPLGVGWGIGSEQELRDAGAETVAATPAELLALLSSR
ncbi:MAG TPA: HAD hydrolase-like protein [Solirubrobacteraceae bacterium]|nr:HAD hydrolase-like protein [Solirubrobacteraceae bacterium]